MRPTSNRLVIVLGAFIGATIALAGGAMAQEQTEPSATNSTTTESTSTESASTVSAVPAHPSRGATMETVKAKFGAPSQEVPAVGKPPISRWEYPGFVVFFENDRVLHTVIAR